jgi:hypothetical protein
VRTAIQQSHHPNRVSERSARRNGIARTRYGNGILASEHRFKDGLLHGLCREWDENGNLLGEFKMVHGTGVQREWHDNGQLKIEVSTVNGEFSGRNRIWLRDGTLIAERFYLHGRQVKPAEYAEAAAEDELLPRYTEPPAKLPGKTPATQRHIHQVFVGGLLEKGNQREARLWLHQQRGTKEKHLLGRFDSQRAAAAFVESLYEAGATEVIIPRIYLDENRNEFAEALLVRLPKARSARVRVRKACALFHEQSLGSVQPDSDIGEEHLYIGMG